MNLAIRGFNANLGQGSAHCSQAAEKALEYLLLALDQEPERTHSIERLLSALELLGLETTPLRQLPLKALQRMTTASRYPDGEEAPVDLFDERDGALAVARAVVGFADQQLAERGCGTTPVMLRILGGHTRAERWAL